MGGKVVKTYVLKSCFVLCPLQWECEMMFMMRRSNGGEESGRGGAKIKRKMEEEEKDIGCLAKSLVSDGGPIQRKGHIHTSSSYFIMCKYV